MFPSTLTYSCLAVKKYSRLQEVVDSFCLEVMEGMEELEELEEELEEERIVLRTREPSRGAANIAGVMLEWRLARD